MGYSERNTWAQLVASLGGMIAYLVIVLPQLMSRPLADVDWVWPMVWSIAGAIVVSIAISIVWGIVAGARDPESVGGTDQRDREIEQFGDRVGQAFLVFGALGALILAMVEANWFWIGNAVFLGFFLSALLGGMARLGAYRQGFQ